MEELKAGEQMEIHATDAGFPRDAEAWCRTTGNRFLSSKSEGGIYKVVVEKATPCAIEASRQDVGREGKNFHPFQ